MYGTITMSRVVTWDQQRQRQRQCIADAGMLSSYPLQISAIATTVPITVPSEVTVLELQSMVHERIQRHKESFAVILERCYGRIRRCASINVMQCSFKVPPFVSGLPLYDFHDCKNYVVNHLIKNGFSIQHNGGSDDLINISWMPVGRNTMAVDGAFAGNHAPGGAFSGSGGMGSGSGGMGGGNPFTGGGARERLMHAGGGGGGGGCARGGGGGCARGGGGQKSQPAVRPISDFRPSVRFRM